MASRYTELGVASDFSPNWGLRQDEFIPALRGTQGIKKYREMRENDPIVGAILTAMDLMIRAVPWSVEAENETDKQFLEDILYNVDSTTWEDFISDVLTFLPYGFSLFEMVAKRRPDGVIALRKLAPRAQWTIDRFDVDDRGDLRGVWQYSAQKSTYIPYWKLLHFRTTSINDAPSGRSVLRSAYTAWYMSNQIKNIEAIAIERELNGLPIMRVPADYMAQDADAGKQAFMSQLKKIARDVKRNEQGYVILPSDLWADDDGKLTTKYLVDFSLVASQGTRDIDTGKTILRYQQDMARSAMADFIMLGANDRGSFALSESKADLFLRALEGYLDTIAATLNRKLVPTIWDWNGKDKASMPKIVRGRVAPVKLEELGNFIQKLSLAGAPLFPDDMLEGHLRDIAGLPPIDPNRPEMEPMVEVPADEPLTGEP
jgi:hypothetical protein